MMHNHRDETVLRVDNIAKSFGGLKVLTDVSLTVRRGELMGLIGPNGAGKTTLFNIITGFLKPDHGTIAYCGKDVTRLKPYQRVRNGIVRTFQKSMVFPDLTVLENLAMAVRSTDGAYRWLGSSAVLRRSDEKAMQLLTQAGMQRHAQKPVCALSYGEQRIIDVLISLAMEPKLLLLDEPTAGLAKEEGEHLISLIQSLGEERSIILVAHDIDIVFSVCDRVAVLDLGRLIACDTPAAIRMHEGAQAAYLGQRATEVAP